MGGKDALGEVEDRVPQSRLAIEEYTSPHDRSWLHALTLPDNRVGLM
jgi:hypothetical protein